MPLLLIFVAVLLVATFIFIASMSQNVQQAEAMTELQAPDNSTGKAIPRLYGRHRLYGNNIFYGNLTSQEIRIDDGGK